MQRFLAQCRNIWHFYAADTLARLERYPEAESQFIEELKKKGDVKPEDERNMTTSKKKYREMKCA